jgi:ATP-dependent HslUV protease subunit HslV
MDAEYHGTTILAIRRNGKAAIGGDGQLSYGETVIKAQEAVRTPWRFLTSSRRN